MKATVLRIVAVAVLGVAAPALAGPWSVPGGAADNFTYNSGGDINGYFGEPFVSGDVFYFTGASFQVNASNGGLATQSDTVSFNVVANPGFQFTEMIVQAFGSYSVVGAGSQVDVDAGLSVTENGGLFRNWGGSLNSLPPFPIAAGSGSWAGQTSVDVSFVFPTPHNDLHVELGALVEAIAGAQGSAEVNLQYEQWDVVVTLIPEPSSIGLLALGALTLLRRR